LSEPIPNDSIAVASNTRPYEYESGSLYYISVWISKPVWILFSG
jgi:hypothetical protein